MNNRQNILLKVIFAFAFILLFASSVSAAHYIVGQVNDAQDTTSANDKIITIWNPAHGLSDNITDIIGINGNSGVDNLYFLDCEALNQPCMIGDTLNVRVFDPGTGYSTTLGSLTITGAGYDLAPALTLDKAGYLNLTLPVNNAGSFNQIVDFDYNLTNSTPINSCNLVIDGTIDKTNTLFSSTQNNFTSNLSLGQHSWSINCTDIYLSKLTSPTRSLTVIKAENFTGLTTNLTGLDINNVTNLTIEKPGIGNIRFTQPINLSGVTNIEDNIVVRDKTIVINSVNLPNLNRSAILSIENITFNHPVVLRDGLVCSDCNIVSYGSGKIVFNVSHFTNYTIAENSQIRIWDSSDISTFYGGMIKIYANFTNRTDSMPITGASCIANISNVSQTLLYNVSSGLYEYNQTMFSSGIYPYSINCSATGYESISLSDIIVVSAYSADFPTTKSVQVINSSRMSLPSPGSINASAGIVDNDVRLFAYVDSNSWQGYFGNVSDKVVLSDSNGNMEYDWSRASPKGIVFASRTTNPLFATAKCADNSELANEEIYTGQSITDVDSIRNTFNEHNHSSFSIGPTIISANNCSSANIFSTRNDAYPELVLSDFNSNMIYTTFIQQNKTGFDNKARGFQMLVPVNNHGSNTSTATYNFFVEIQ